MLIIGRSQSGKTTLGVKVITWLRPQVDELIVCSPTYGHQETWAPIEDYVTAHHDSVEVIMEIMQDRTNQANGGDDNNKKGDEETSPTATTMSDIMANTTKSGTGNEGFKRTMLVLDDVSYERMLNEGNKGTLNGLTYNSVWYNLTIVCIIHKTANIGAGMKENCDHLILFRTTNQKEEIILWETFGIVPVKKQFLALYNRLIDQQFKEGNMYPFIYVCFKRGLEIYADMKVKINLL